MSDLFGVPEDLRAISLWQPWASAMALGWKRNETRHWSTPYRGPMAIHAAKRWTWEEKDEWECVLSDHAFDGLPEQPPLGAIVAIGILVDIRRTEIERHAISAQEDRWGNYSAGRFAWIFENIRALAEPIPCRGRQSIWRLDPDVARLVALNVLPA